uniref:ANK_REP_REGION domain-containing protein n=1 Tax=Strongyloides papillosus TaxID=174720 RepID=A0A0N5BP19_STREA
MTSNLSFLGTSNLPNKKRYSIASFPVANNILKDKEFELIDTVIDIFDKDKEGNTSLMRAIKEYRPIAVQKIMKKAFSANSINKLLSIQNNNGETALKLASEAPNLAIKEYLEGIKIKKINPLLENIKISTNQSDESLIKNLNNLPEIIKPNMFGKTIPNSFIPTIAENEQQKIFDDYKFSITPRIRSISIAGGNCSGNSSLNDYGRITHKVSVFPSQELKDVISMNEVGNNKKYSTDTGYFSKKNSLASSKSSNASESPLFDSSFEVKRNSISRHLHIDGAIDISTNFFPVMKNDDNSKQKPETNFLLMLSDKVKNFNKKKEGYQGYSCYDTQLLYMSKEQMEYNNNDYEVNKKIENENDLLDLTEYHFEKKYSLNNSFNSKQSINEQYEKEIENNHSIKSRSQSLSKISAKSPLKF